MATKLDKDITRESTIQIDGREVLVTLSKSQEIELRLKGLKSGRASISIQELYNQLNGVDNTPQPKTEGSIIIDHSKVLDRGNNAMISVHNFRSLVLISKDLDLNTKVKLESILVQLIDDLKTKKR